jgi:cytochrome P450
VLNSIEDVSRLLEDKGAIYSHRPRVPFASEIVGWGEMLVMLPDGPQLKEQRRLCAQFMGTRTLLDGFVPVIEGETRKFAKKLLDEPESSRLRLNIRRCAMLFCLVVRAYSNMLPERLVLSF